MNNHSAVATGPIPGGPESTHNLFEKFLNEGDLAKILSLYEPKAVLVEQKGAVVSGTDAIRGHL